MLWFHLSQLLPKAATGFQTNIRLTLAQAGTVVTLHPWGETQKVQRIGRKSTNKINSLWHLTHLSPCMSAGIVESVEEWSVVTWRVIYWVQVAFGRRDDKLTWRESISSTYGTVWECGKRSIAGVPVSLTEKRCDTEVAVVIPAELQDTIEKCTLMLLVLLELPVN